MRKLLNTLYITTEDAFFGSRWGKYYRLDRDTEKDDSPSHA